MYALACFMRMDEAGGTAILDKWTVAAPPELQWPLKSYRRIGNTILWHWQAIIDDYQSSLEKNNGKVESSFRLSASRAFAEVGDIESATKCLVDAKLEEARYNPRSLAQGLLPFFCLTGDRAHVEKILHQVSHGKRALPEYSRKYWLGRCLVAEGKVEDAKTAFEQALHLINSNNGTSFSLWQKRIQHVLNEAEQSDGLPPAWLEKDDRIWRLLQRVSFIQSIVQPNKHSYVVASLCLAIVLMHILSNLYIYFPYPENEQLRITMYSLGILDPKRVLVGEYWRLVTYLFLHSNDLHLFVNVVGLYWFGRIAQNIFGTTRFLFIFFLTGLLSGISQTLFDYNQLAVGASGAVMGVFGAAGAGIFRMKRYLPRSIWQAELTWLAALALMSTISDQMIPHVAAFAHTGGMVAGVLFGLIVRVPKPAYAVKDRAKPVEKG
jgi:rhomboid protease GluP